MPSRQPTAEALAAAREWHWSHTGCFDCRDEEITGSDACPTCEQGIQAHALLLDRWALRAKAEAAEELRDTLKDMHGYAAEICLRRATRYRAELAEMEGGIDD